MKIIVGISNRHVHLTKETFNILFPNHNLEVVRYLSQPGEFASNLYVNIKTDKKVIERVRILGPFRNYNQVEIMQSDADVLGLNPPKRNSGDLKNSESICVYSDFSSVDLKNSVIIANRHIHMTFKDADAFNLKNNQVVSIKKEDTIIDDVHIKISDTYKLECHLDKDDELKYDIHNYDEVEIVEDSI